MMHIEKVASASPEFLKFLLWGNGSLGCMGRDCGLEQEMKVLGINYNMEEETFYPSIKVLTETKFTKRQVLSTISGVWDPLGICAGVLLKGKLIFQSITRLGHRWDQSIDNQELLDFFL